MFNLVTSVSDFFISIISVFNKLVSCFRVGQVPAGAQFSNRYEFDKCKLKQARLEVFELLTNFAFSSSSSAEPHALSAESTWVPCSDSWSSLLTSRLFSSFSARSEFRSEIICRYSSRFSFWSFSFCSFSRSSSLLSRHFRSFSSSWFSRFWAYNFSNGF